MSRREEKPEKKEQKNAVKRKYQQKGAHGGTVSQVMNGEERRLKNECN